MGLQSTRYSCCYLITLSVTHSFFPVLDCMLHESREPWDLVTTIVVVQSLSHVQLFATPWTAACQASLSITNSWIQPKLMSIKHTESPYVFDWEHGIALHPMQGIRSSSPEEGDVSRDLSSCGRNLGYILELQQGWPFETPLCSAKSGLLSS